MMVILLIGVIVNLSDTDAYINKRNNDQSDLDKKISKKGDGKTGKDEEPNDEEPTDKDPAEEDKETPDEKDPPVDPEED